MEVTDTAAGVQEAQTNGVNISAEDFSPELVDCAISFIYSGGWYSLFCRTRPVCAFSNVDPVVNIEKLNTNDSMVDACVRLWVIADFLVLKELQSEAMTILEKYLDEKLQALCISGPVGDEIFMSDKDYCILLAQLFCGIETAYTTYPHSVPCQQLLVDFFHAARTIVFCTEAFSDVMSNAPRQFSHELLMATIDGRQSKWVRSEELEFRFLQKKDGCTGCGKLESNDHGSQPWAVDPSVGAIPRQCPGAVLNASRSTVSTLLLTLPVDTCTNNGEEFSMAQAGFPGLAESFEILWG